MSWAPPGARGRFDDIHSVQQGGLIDEDHVERRKIIKRETVRRRIADGLLERGTINEIFNKIDADGSGDVDIAELVTALGKMGLSIVTQDADDLLLEIDADGDGKISFGEFEAFMKSDQTSSKVKSFDVKLQQRRRNQQTSQVAINDSVSSAVSFGKQADQTMQSDYNNMTNGKPMPPARRTSFALGHDVKRESFYAEREFRRVEKREQVRKTLSSRLAQEGGVSKLFAKIDSDKSGDISVKEMKRSLDKMGLSIMHQDSEAIINAMDSDNSGKVSEVEFTQFLGSDHQKAMKEAEQQALNDAVKFQNKNCSPHEPGADRPFMRPTIISTKKLVKQVFRRQSISGEDGGQRTTSNLAIQFHGAASVNAVLTPPNIGKGLDGKIYGGLETGRRNSTLLGRKLLPSLTVVPSAESRAPTSSNTKPLSPRVTTKASTFPLSKGMSRTGGFKQKPPRPSTGFGPFSASFRIKQNTIHNFSSSSQNNGNRNLYQPAAPRPKSKMGEDPLIQLCLCVCLFVMLQLPYQPALLVTMVCIMGQYQTRPD